MARNPEDQSDLDPADDDLDPDLDTGDSDDDPDQGEPEPESEPDKRIADLISARDKADSRANAAEKLLKAVRSKGSEGSDDPELTAMRSELRDASLDAVYSAQPKLAEYGIDRALVEGSTRTELRESADQLVALIEQVETRATNKMLSKYGLKADPGGGSREKSVDFASMPKAEFEALVARSKTGGESF